MDVEKKIDRVARYARERGLSGVLLGKQPNFAWLTDGQTNRIDGSVEVGEGCVLITASGERYVVANTIEMPRLRDEALRGLDFSPIEYAWTDDHADGAAPVTAARRVVGGTLGSDLSASEVQNVSADITRLQTPLLDGELSRYRALGRDVATSVERLCRSLRPGITECAIAGEVNSVVALTGARAVVTLVAADDRIAAFRHPVPTSHAWHHTLLVGLCAERDGLVVALSRVIAARPSPALQDLTRATATVFAALIAATAAGATGADLFAAATAAYRAVGFAGQEALHHQGGAIGYRSRDWIAHPGSTETVRDRQAFAWNPSITGSKVEDTVLLLDGETEVITRTGAWPSIDVQTGRGVVPAAGVLEL